MSKYTTEVRYICEVNAGLSESKGYDNVNDIISKSRSKIFSFNYPIFDEAYRSVLETKILKHFYTREIGFETVGLWKLKLDMRMNEIMPYYNKLYNSELIEYNPLYDTNLTRDHTKENEGTDSKTGNGTSKNVRDKSDSGWEHSQTDFEGETNYDSLKWDYYHDTPQGGVSSLNDSTYLTNARKNTQDDTTTQESTTETNSSYNNIGKIEDNGSTTKKEDGEFETTENYLEHVVGKSSGMSYSKMILEFRDTFLNIDMMIIRDLEELFMQLW